MTDLFLNIQGIKGESTDMVHKDWCEVISFEWRVSQAASVGVGARDPRPDFADLVVTKVVDRASPTLYLACADGRHITKVVLEGCRAGGEGQKLHLRITMKDVVVAGAALSSMAGARGSNDPVDTISFRYSEIKWEYFEMTHVGRTSQSGYDHSWSLKTNKGT